MNDKEILKRAIKKAHKNGWNEAVDFNRLDWSITYDVNFIEYQYYYAIIFSHKFAEALWGIKETNTNNYDEWGGILYIPAFVFHLKKMCIYTDKDGNQAPLQYLEKFI